MNFVYLSPHFPEVHMRFCLELAHIGVTVLGIGDAPYDSLAPELKHALTEYYYLPSLEDYAAVFRAVAFFSFKYGKIDWLESNNEHWLEHDARLRTDFNISTGMKTDEIQKIKSKRVMTDLFCQAGIPTARQAMYNVQADQFVEEVGYPIIAKPEIGVGALDSYKLHDDVEWRSFKKLNLTVPYVLEEFIDGDIVSFDGIAGADSRPVFACHCEFPPSILDIMRLWQDLNYRVMREIPPKLQALGEKILQTFDVRNRWFHLEFFRLRKARQNLGEAGDYIALEVNMRPAGGYTPDMYNYATDSNVYRVYAELVAYGEPRQKQRATPYYCSYSARRDEYRYELSHEAILSRYADGLMQFGRNPEMSWPQMCNDFYLYRSTDREQIRRFEEDVVRHAVTIVE